MVSLIDLSSCQSALGDKQVERLAVTYWSQADIDWGESYAIRFRMGNARSRIIDCQAGYRGSRSAEDAG
jgi:hypothetical protein